ncbi:MAG: hypothetical protein RI963_2001 [Planctomycetota bacterium]
MHEFSLLRSILAQVADIAASHPAASHSPGPIREIRIRCGELAGVEPALLDEAFRMLAPGSRWESTRLSITLEPLSARCDGCGLTCHPDRFRFVCPHCGSRQLREIAGDQVIIESILLGDAAPCVANPGTSP